MDDFDTFQKPPIDLKEVSRLAIKAAKMKKETVVKNKFSQINDETFYFPDGILSLLFHHPNLKKPNEFKEKMVQRIEKYFWNKKEKVLDLERKALKDNSRLYLYHQVLTSAQKFFNISREDNFKQEKIKLFKKIQKI